MPAGDLTTFLTKGVMYHLNMTVLSAQTSPTEQQVVDMLNDSVIKMVDTLRPRRSKAGEMTIGRLDKLTKITLTAAVSASSGTVALPSSGETRTSHIISVLLGMAGVLYYPAVEVSLKELQDRSVSNYIPAVTDPIYAFGDGKVYYLPISLDSIFYQRIRMPASMVISSSENFPLDDDLMPLAIYRTAGYFWMVKKNSARAKRYLDFYKAVMSFYVGKSNVLIEDWVY